MDVTDPGLRSLSMLRYRALFVFLILMIVLACDDNFEPLQENDRYFFSMHGYLDATADTQWVRISPLKEGLVQVPSLDGVTVLIGDTGGHSIAEMKDSLFYFGYDSYAWVYWTTFPVDYRQSYRITAINADGDFSNVKVDIPGDFPVPVITTTLENNPNETQQFAASAEGIENLADVSVIYYVDEIFNNKQHIFRYAHKDRAGYTGPGSYAVTIPQQEDIVRIARFFHPEFLEALTMFTITHRQLFIASAGSGWINFSGLDEFDIVVPDGVADNVVNGTGHVAGVVSKTIPVQNCYDEHGDSEPCPTEIPGFW